MSNIIETQLISLGTLSPQGMPPGGVGKASLATGNGLDLETVDGTELDRDDDLMEVVDSVQRLAASWSNLALYIHVRGDAIKVIQRNNPVDVQQSLQDAIMEWLKKNYNFEKLGPPSWRMLVGAVRRLDNALAHEIANKHRLRGAASTGSTNPPQVATTLNPPQIANSQSSSQGTATQIPILGTLVTLPRLNLIKWRDERGGEHKLRLLEQMSVKWRQWGEVVGISAAILDGFAKQHLGNNQDCMRAVVTQWQQRDFKEYPATWEGLITLLEDIDMDELVSQIQQAAADPNSNLHPK